MRQTVGNACGTVGLLHAVGNVTSKIQLRMSIRILHYLSVLCILFSEQLVKNLEILFSMWYEFSLMCCHWLFS